MKRATLDALLTGWQAQRALVLVTDLGGGGQQLIEPGAGGAEADAVVQAAATDALRRDQCLRLEHAGRALFVQPWNRPLRMIVVGAVHIAQPLAAMATLSGYAVTIVDPRQAFATAERFPGVTLAPDWPDVALRALVPDARTAVVTLTHDPKLDDPALVEALRSPAFYVGALGSRKTHAARVARLTALGLAEDELARIHAPVGLDVGARSPAEIAVSILGQVTERLRKPTP